MDAAEIRDQLLAEILDGGPAVQGGFDEYATFRRLKAPRAQVREALSSLAEAGLLTRAPRVGTTLSNPLFHWSVEDASTMPSSGLVPLVFNTLNVERVRAGEAISRELIGEPGAEVTRIQRVSEINGKAAEHWTIWTVLQLPAEMYSIGLPRNLNWYEVVGSLTGEQTFTMSRRGVNCRATESDIGLLDVTLGDPLRFTSRLLSSADGTPIDRSWGRINSQLLVSSEQFTIRL